MFRLRFVLRALTAFACFGLFAGPVRATLVVLVPTEQLVTAADRVVLGRVEAVQSYWSASRIVTKVTVQIEQTLKGTVESRLVFEAMGGRVGDVSMRVAGAPTFAAGQRAIVLLRAQGGTNRAFGLSQGKLDVTRSADGEDRVPWVETDRAETRVALSAAVARIRRLAEPGPRK
jgi:hypothetical protein